MLYSSTKAFNRVYRATVIAPCVFVVLVKNPVQDGLGDGHITGAGPGGKSAAAQLTILIENDRYGVS